MNVLFLRVVADGNFRHDEGETVTQLFLNCEELAVVVLVPPQLAHAVLSGIVRRHEDAGENPAIVLLSLVLILVIFNLGLLDDN